MNILRYLAIFLSIASLSMFAACGSKSNGISAGPNPDDGINGEGDVPGGDNGLNGMNPDDGFNNGNNDENPPEGVYDITLDEKYQFKNMPMGTLTDDRDGRIYKTVTINGKTWMAENLKFVYNEGSAQSFCYQNDPNNCETLGRLYTWAAAMDSLGKFSNGSVGCGYFKGINECDVDLGGAGCNYEHDKDQCDVDRTANPTPVRGICPSGWHMPMYQEWEALLNFVDKNGGYIEAGTMLKSSEGWEWYPNPNNMFDQLNGNGLDNYSFTVLPAGSYMGQSWIYEYDEDFHGLGTWAYFWSSAQHLPTEWQSYCDETHCYGGYMGLDDWVYGTSAFAFYFTNYNTEAKYDFVDKSAGLSVRCIMD